MDCDCLRTGSCQAGEPPPPPIYEFLPDLVEHTYGRHDKKPIEFSHTEEKRSVFPRDKQEPPPPPPTKFPQGNGQSYEFHWSGWYSPYTEGPRPGDSAFHGYPEHPGVRRRWMLGAAMNMGIIVRVTNDPDHKFENDVRKGRVKLFVESAGAKPVTGSGVGLLVFILALVWVVM
jgi:hypothetical protein